MRHLLIWPCKRKSAMSTLQVGQAFRTFRSRMALLPPAACRTGTAAAVACKQSQLSVASAGQLLACKQKHHSTCTRATWPISAELITHVPQVCPVPWL